MNLDKAEEFLKSKGVDTENYVIHDIKGGYQSQIPIALWLTEFAEQQVKNNGVLDGVINCDCENIDIEKVVSSIVVVYKCKKCGGCL